MSEEQKAKYESAAKKYRDNNFIKGTPLHTYSPIIFMRGTEHAHPIGFNLGKEEGKVEGWNEALKEIEDSIISRITPHSAWKAQVLIELKKLRK